MKPLLWVRDHVTGTVMSADESAALDSRPMTGVYECPMKLLRWIRDHMTGVYECPMNLLRWIRDHMTGVYECPMNLLSRPAVTMSS